MLRVWKYIRALRPLRRRGNHGRSSNMEPQDRAGRREKNVARVGERFGEEVSKYGNKQTAASDGKVLASKRECKRYEELLLLQKMRKISDLETQVKYQLLPKQKLRTKIEQPVYYIADFKYYDRELERWRVEDAKGFRTKEYVIKRKLMMYRHDIHVEEV
jgi:hypothetical protein